jgi:hypothetical protein
VAHEFDVESLRRQLDRIDAAAEDVRLAVEGAAEGGVVASLFPARPSPGCAGCDFHRSCPEGRAAAPQARRPWYALEADVG